MTKSKQNHLKQSVVNFLGAVGYFFSALQWMIVFVIYQTAIMAFVTSFVPVPAQQTPTPPPVNLPGPGLGEAGANLPMTILAGLVVLGAIALSVFVFIKAPSFAAKASKKAVHAAADVSTTLALHANNQSVAPSRRKKLTAKFVIVIKLIIVVVPLGLSLMAGVWSDGTLDQRAATALSAGLAAGAALFFAGQYGLAKVFKIKYPDLS